MLRQLSAGDLITIVDDFHEVYKSVNVLFVILPDFEAIMEMFTEDENIIRSVYLY